MNPEIKILGEKHMETIIIYGSCYGTAKVYAEALAERLKSELLPYDKVKEPAGYERIIYVGGLYAGGVRGMARTAKKIPAAQCKKFIVITVGLADPADEKNVQNIRKSALRQIPESLADKTEFYHLRGGIDYGKLSFKHRLMMKMLYEQVKKQPVGEQDTDTRAIIETYVQKVSFVDTECLEDIVKKLED